ncbi:protein PIN-LIKES 3-like isoform X1 [Lotus japonicus]|uniref:protein PIN-LIKES 3-like isoform X1 n=2 Tax=Lotus japonicus TaxID=34305 RepID=UPI0025847156|nr:protein PIN-LIKES 3-like isoform X1 [Lotus japonicus]XP_057421852.1 protein PIN-LIKES 3-like isoform X1 [Lotus japonicus]XP_057421853.1 protein PIN-LIKES 3-like isoform X1 [Lotus japonicus]XP_057421854.1 protein PIN-LIKES 3-like isoform X1 [Lotus japonicus]
MGFLELLSVASYPVMKVLLITAIGVFLALDNIDVLGADARKKVNNLVFYVFNPSLVGSNLAKTLTSENVLSLWFMPVNVIVTFILGSALAWILIKITRPPKHLEGLILGCCSAGNLGNLPIIIIPAICKDKDSPFGEPDICYQYGMAYVSLSMAVGAVLIWTYVYYIMRVSSKTLHKESGTISQSQPDNISETPTPAKDTLDDAYTQLLPTTESQEKVKVSISYKIKSQLWKISSNINFGHVFAPSTIGAITGFSIGVIPPIRNFLVGNNAPLRVVEDSASMLGDAAIPTVTLILGANLLGGLKGTSTPLWTIVGIILVRYIFLPLLGVVIVKGAVKFGLVPSDPLYQFVLLLQYALPPAMNIGTMAQLFGTGQSEFSVIMLWSYALASIAVTLWSTYFMWLVA